MPRKIKNQISTPELISLYNGGASELSLSRKYGCSRGAIRSRLVAGNVTIRSRSEASIVSARNFTLEQRKERTKKANAALRGSKNRTETKIKRAQYYEKHVELRQSKYELEFDDALRRHNIVFKPQKSFNVYNIDFAFEDRKIALEIFGGIWHGSGRHVEKFNKKSELLIEDGWTIVVVWCRGGLDSDAVIDYISSIDTSTPRHYVITGNAKESRIGKNRLNYIPRLI